VLTWLQELANLPLALQMHMLPAGFSWEEDTYLFCGTVDYSSVRTLFGRHPTPKDDLEGLACTLLEMASGEGWQCRDRKTTRGMLPCRTLHGNLDSAREVTQTL
jgi:hypothetical protein